MKTDMPLHGKTCLVTGATNGHGEAVAKMLARLGGDMVLLGRSREKCGRVQREIEQQTGKKPVILLCDLTSRQDITRAAKEFLSWERPLHVLINNAGVVNPGFRTTADGIEETFAVNYCAMFQLTMLLIERIKESAPARIINVSSDTHIMARLDLDDIDGKNKGYSIMGSYGRSKLAIVYFTRELARRLQGSGVTVNAVDPGPIASGIAKKPGILASIADFIIQRTFPKPERAARTAVYLASSPEIEGATGGYYRFMKKKEPTLKRDDPEFYERFWEISMTMVGLKK